MVWLWPLQFVFWWAQYIHMPISPSLSQHKRWRANVLLVPSDLLPAEQSAEQFFKAPRREPRTPEWGCSLAGNRAHYWLPRRGLLWLFLRWPLECEAMHWLQTCDLDRCNGIRGEHVTVPPERTEGVTLIVRCDEFGSAFGPYHAVQYSCHGADMGMSLCVREHSSYSFHLHPCHNATMNEDVPCATPEMKAARKAWRRERSCVDAL